MIQPKADEFDFEYDDLPCKACGGACEPCDSVGKARVTLLFRVWSSKKQMAWMPKTKLPCLQRSMQYYRGLN